jgi:hypothetical protein
MEMKLSKQKELVDKYIKDPGNFIIPTNVTKSYKKFLDFSNILLGYFYNNVSCPYYVCKRGIPFSRSKLISEASKYRKRKGTKVKNLISNYIGFDGMISINETEIKSNTGDLTSDEYNSFYMGRHIVRNGDRPQKYSI